MAVPEGVATAAEEPRHHYDRQRRSAYAFGVVFVVAMLVLAIFLPNPTGFQFLVFRVVLALAAAGVAATFPGIIEIEVPGWSRAGGALGVFLVVYSTNPAQHITETAPSVLEQPLNEVRLRQWEAEHEAYLRTNGRPGASTRTATFFYQFFAGGFVLYDAAGGRTYIFDAARSRYDIVSSPTQNISDWGDRKGAINAAVFETVLPPEATPALRVDYRRMLENQEIIGGIGTVYVRENLLGRLRRPLDQEYPLERTLVVEGPVYDLIVGVMNSHNDDPADEHLRAVLVLEKAPMTYLKHPVTLP